MPEYEKELVAAMTAAVANGYRIGRCKVFEYKLNMLDPVGALWMFGDYKKVDKNWLNEVCGYFYGQKAAEESYNSWLGDSLYKHFAVVEY